MDKNFIIELIKMAMGSEENKIAPSRLTGGFDTFAQVVPEFRATTEQLASGYGAGREKTESLTVTDCKNLNTLNRQVGEKVIIRTYSAGVHFGLLAEKAGNEVILHGSRRLFRFQCPLSVSLSDVALHGIDQTRSKICEAVPMLWLEAIEILSVTDECIKSLESSEVAQQE